MSNNDLDALDGVVDAAARTLVAGDMPHGTRARVLSIICERRRSTYIIRRPMVTAALASATVALWFWFAHDVGRLPIPPQPPTTEALAGFAASEVASLLRPVSSDREVSHSRPSVTPATIRIKVEPVVVSHIEIAPVVVDPVRVVAVKIDQVQVSFP